MAALMLRDPLIHFLAAGAVLFVVFAWRGDEPAPGRIVISADQVARLERSAALLEGRPLTEPERRALVEPFIRDEVYYREALALGLDENDDEVRRRLIEKMRYVSENLADPEPPSDAELADYHAANPGRFELPATATFDQVYFSPEQRGDALEADVAAALAALEAGADPAGAGDRTPLDGRLTAASRERVEVLFGEALTEAVFGGDTDRWLGPYRSDFGLHLIRVVERSAARRPPFEEIADRVRAVYVEDRREAANEAAYREMRARYDIVVRWPDDPAAGDAQ